MGNKKILWMLWLGSLLIAMISNWYGESIKRDPCFIATVIEENLRPEIGRLETIVDEFKYDPRKLNELLGKGVFDDYINLYYFDEGVLKYWTDFKVTLPYYIIPKEDGLSFLSFDGSKYLVKKRTIKEGKVLVGVITLLKQFPFENKYLKPSFNNRIFPAQDLEIYHAISENQVTYQQQYLFSVVGTNAKHWIPRHISRITAIFYSLAAFLFLLLLTIYAHLISKNGYFIWGLVLLVLMILGLRSLMVWLGFPNNIIEFPLFDSTYFTKDSITPSLGDFLLNLVCLLWTILFAQNGLRYSTLLKSFIVSKSIALWVIVLTVITILSIVAFYFIYGNIRSILINSQIVLDVSKNITFDILRTVSILIFFFSSLIFFFVQYLNLKLLKRLWFRSKPGFIIVLILAVSTFYVLFPKNWELFIALIAAFWGIASSFRVIRYLGKVRYLTFLYLFLAAIVTSVLGSFAIYKQYEFDEEIKKSKFANRLLIERDILGEYLLSQVVDRITEDDFIASRLYSEKLAKGLVSEQINKYYLIDYFDKYSANVSLFSPSGKAFSQNQSPLNLEDFIKDNLTLKDTTEYKNIYYVNQVGVSDRYYVKIPFTRFDRLLGTIILELTLKRYASNSVYPELLIENKYSSASHNFDYAFFDSGRVVMKVGDFNYLRNFDQKYLDDEIFYKYGIESNGYHHLGVKTQSGKKIVITSSVYERVNILTNFSFLFLVQTLGIGLIIFIYRYFIYRQKGEFYFSTKIQLFLGASFFIPLLVVSVAILNSLNSSYQEEIDRSYQKRAIRIERNANDLLVKFFENKISKENVRLVLSNISELVQNDVNIYDLDGKLVAYSQKLIYDAKILSKQINPYALHEILRNNREGLVLDESIGKLEYKTTYLSIKDTNTSEVIGILGMPFFDTKNHKNRQQVEVFGSLINIFILIFIVSLIISYFAVQILTEPLNLLTQKIKKTSFSDLDQPLEYSAKDEIGILVSEYNDMLKKFEESKTALAKSEKEAAWKTIAQQVAHEIKNPLTPMKLTLQQMKRVQGEEDALAIRPINNLLHQVDVLADIATSFSTFAKMPIPESAPFDLAIELKKSVDLFENEKGNIFYNSNVSNLMVNGDVKLTGRIFNNLIINAFQSVPEDRQPEVNITLEKKQKKAMIVISDNGSGIPEEFHNKIFIPNFTTKIKGSGIGLALSKRGIEHAGGDVWFETSDSGTTFYIEWPI